MAHPLLPTGPVLWLALADAGNAVDPMEPLIPQLDVLLAFTAEIDARLEATGVPGIAGALSLHDRIRDALAAVSTSDLEARVAAVARLREQLDDIAKMLDALRRLKLAVG